MMRFFLAATALIVAAATGPARAERDVPVAPEYGATLQGTLSLSLDNAIAMGLENNLEVEIERHAPLIAEEDYRISWAPTTRSWEARPVAAFASSPGAT